MGVCGWCADMHTQVLSRSACVWDILYGSWIVKTTVSESTELLYCLIWHCSSGEL